MSKRWYLDMAERAVWTFAQAAAAILIVQQSWNIDVLKVAVTAGGIAILKAILATRIGDGDSAATWPSGEGQ